MGRRKKYSDEGASLFDDSTPLKLPEFPSDELTSPEIFLRDSKETLGYIAKINRILVRKIADGEQPNYPLLKALNDLARTTTHAMTSYDGVVKLETKDSKTPAEVNINIVAKE